MVAGGDGGDAGVGQAAGGGGGGGGGLAGAQEDSEGGGGEVCCMSHNAIACVYHLSHHDAACPFLFESS